MHTVAIEYTADKVYDHLQLFTKLTHIASGLFSLTAIFPNFTNGLTTQENLFLVAV